MCDGGKGGGDGGKGGDQEEMLCCHWHSRLLYSRRRIRDLYFYSCSSHVTFPRKVFEQRHLGVERVGSGPIHEQRL